jgi:CO/xanthine dehydrogenase Mo-binding subunit
MANGLIGQDVPRSDARGKVTGQASYIGDFELPGMLYARILRSPVPHARIAHFDVSAASALPGVTVLTAADFERWGLSPCYGPVLADQPVVAAGGFVGLC